MFNRLFNYSTSSPPPDPTNSASNVQSSQESSQTQKPVPTKVGRFGIHKVFTQKLFIGQNDTKGVEQKITSSPNESEPPSESRLSRGKNSVIKLFNKFSDQIDSLKERLAPLKEQLAHRKEQLAHRIDALKDNITIKDPNSFKTNISTPSGSPPPPPSGSAPPIPSPWESAAQDAPPPAVPDTPPPVPSPWESAAQDAPPPAVPNTPPPLLPAVPNAPYAPPPGPPPAIPDVPPPGLPPAVPNTPPPGLPPSIPDALQPPSTPPPGSSTSLPPIYHPPLPSSDPSNVSAPSFSGPNIRSLTPSEKELAGQTNELTNGEQTFYNNVDHIITLAQYLKDNITVFPNSTVQEELDSIMENLSKVRDESHQLADALKDAGDTSHKLMVLGGEPYRNYLHVLSKNQYEGEYLRDLLNQYRSLIKENPELQKSYERFATDYQTKTDNVPIDNHLSKIFQRPIQHTSHLTEISKHYVKKKEAQNPEPNKNRPAGKSQTPTNPNYRALNKFDLLRESINSSMEESKNLNEKRNFEKELPQLKEQVEASRELLKFATTHMPKDKLLYLKTGLEEFAYRLQTIENRYAVFDDYIKNENPLDPKVKNELNEYKDFVKNQTILSNFETLVIPKKSLFLNENQQNLRKEYYLLKEKYNKANIVWKPLDFKP